MLTHCGVRLCVLVTITKPFPLEAGTFSPLAGPAVGNKQTQWVVGFFFQETDGVIFEAGPLQGKEPTRDRCVDLGWQQLLIWLIMQLGAT